MSLGAFRRSTSRALANWSSCSEVVRTGRFGLSATLSAFFCIAFCSLVSILVSLSYSMLSNRVVGLRFSK